MKDPFKALKGMIGDVLLSFINEAQDRQSGRPAEHPNQIKREKRRQDIQKRREQRKEESRAREQARRDQRKHDSSANSPRKFDDPVKSFDGQADIFRHPAMNKEDTPKPVVVEKGDRRVQLDPGIGILAFGKNINVVVNGITETTSSNMVPTNQYDIMYIREGVVVDYVAGTVTSPPPSACAALDEASVPGDLITVYLTYATALANF